MFFSRSQCWWSPFSQAWTATVPADSEPHIHEEHALSEGVFIFVIITLYSVCHMWHPYDQYKQTEVDVFYFENFR